MKNTQDERHTGWLTDTQKELELRRPKTRKDCLPGGCNGERPCVFWSCPYHLAIEHPKLNRLGKSNRKKPMTELEEELVLKLILEAEHNCALDVVDKLGQATLHQVGEIIGMSRERVRQIEYHPSDDKGYLLRLRHASRRDFLAAFQDGAQGEFSPNFHLEEAI